MANGRIDVYLHSDSITENKGGAMVRVLCETDFAAHTSEFKEFTRAVAVKAFAAKAESWADIISVFEDIEVDRKELEKRLREKISIDEITVLGL